MKIPFFVVSAIVVLAPVSARADVAADMDCEQPQELTLPPSVDSAAEFDALRTSLKNFLDESSAFRLCLAQYADSKKASLTGSEKRQLKTLYRQSENGERAAALRWNKLHSQYASGQTDKVQ